MVLAQQYQKPHDPPPTPPHPSLHHLPKNKEIMRVRDNILRVDWAEFRFVCHQKNVRKFANIIYRCSALLTRRRLFSQKKRNTKIARRNATEMHLSDASSLF
jgi:hypothetical protein